jgi:putative aldouronate transport system permease protein
MQLLKRQSGAAALPASRARARPVAGTRALKGVKHSWQLYVLLALPMLYLLVFKYIPMYGVQIAFRDYNVIQGFSGSPWVGLKYFQRFVTSYNFWPILRNTVVLNVYQLAAGFPLPILLALALNHLRRERFKKAVQLVSYAPHFISTVVLVGIVLQLLDPQFGLVNTLLRHLGVAPINFMGHAEYFKSIYVWSGVWQNLGFDAIIYLAALTSIDPTLHEAAIIDGASKVQRIRHIDLPGILPIAIILLILNMGAALDTGFEKVLLFQNPLNLSTSEVIDTYVYRVGLVSAIPQFSYAAAIGLFKSVIGLILIFTVNQVARKARATSLW